MWFDEAVTTQASYNQPQQSHQPLCYIVDIMFTDEPVT